MSRLTQDKIEKRLAALEVDSHPPQNYRRRCAEMEAKVVSLEEKLKQVEQLVASIHSDSSQNALYK